MLSDEVFLIDKKELKKYVPYSISHIYRLIKAGKFPPPVSIGLHRVAWLSTDIFRWIRWQVNGRSQWTPGPIPEPKK